MSYQFAAELLACATKSAIILAITFTLLSLMQRRSSAERHLIWAAVIAALLLLPAIQLLGPSVPLPIDRVDADDASALFELTEPSSTGGSVRDAVAAQLRGQTREAAAEISASELGVGWWWIVLGAYALVAVLLLIRLAVLTLRRSRYAAALTSIEDGETLSLIDALRLELGMRRSIRAVISEHEGTPWTWGLVHPVVVLPVEFAQWSRARRRRVLLHELSHIQRLDQLTVVLGQLTCALHWYQPLVWIAAKRMMHEAEHACDDRVLVLSGEPFSYAEELLAIANRIFRDGSSPTLVTPMVGKSMISRRIRAVLDPKTRRNTVDTFRVALVLSLAFGLIVPVAMLQAQQVLPPAHDDDVRGLIEGYLEDGKPEEAVELLADWIVRDRTQDTGPLCSFCLEELRQLPKRPATVAVLLAAFDRVEQRARTGGNGELLQRLARLSVDSKHRTAVERGMYYLFEADRVGNTGTADVQLMSVQYLSELGYYEQARSLAAEMHADASSPFYQSDTTQRWIDYLESRSRFVETIASRLKTVGTVPIDREGEYTPYYKELPVYPSVAYEQKLQGSAVVEFTVSSSGRTRDVTVVSSTDPLFEQPSVEAASNFLYLPRMESGMPVEVTGVRNKITYVLDP